MDDQKGRIGEETGSFVRSQVAKWDHKALETIVSEKCWGKNGNLTLAAAAMAVAKHLAWGRFGDLIDFENIAAEVTCSYLQNYHRIENREAWLWKAVRNLLDRDSELTFRKEPKPDENEHPLDDVPSNDPRAESDDDEQSKQKTRTQYEALLSAIDERLTRNLKVTALMLLDGLSPRELAKKRGIKWATVRKHQQRIHKAIGNFPLG